MLREGFNWGVFLITMVVLIIAITIHEFAHAMTADRCGDPTPRSQGRISLNPIDHLDPMGSVLMVLSSLTGFGLGWGRPVQYNPYNLKNPRWDQLKIAIWGPISNIGQALVFSALVRLNDHQGWLPSDAPGTLFLRTGVYINLVLAIFNMIPIPPLDGSKILSSLLPLPQAETYERVMSQIGMFLFLGLIFTGLSWRLIGPPVDAVFHFLIG